MNHKLNGDGRVDTAPDRLVVVRVEEAIEPQLTPRGGTRYQSPPQTREQALTLVRLLLGWTEDPHFEQERWTAPIVGGRRLVSITDEPVDEARHAPAAGLDRHGRDRSPCVRLQSRCASPTECPTECRRSARHERGAARAC
jgi:hypothetical protein